MNRILVPATSACLCITPFGRCRYAWQEVEGDVGGDAKTRVADAAKEALKEQLVRCPCPGVTGRVAYDAGP